MVETDAIIESFARHLMAAFDQWNEFGFDPIARDFLSRLSKRKAGELRGIDVNGDLLTKVAGGGEERTSLLEGFSRVAWYDPLHRAPKLD